jgi:hypothetical protein
VPVVGTQPEAGFKQPLRDRPAHVADADKSEFALFVCDRIHVQLSFGERCAGYIRLRDCSGFEPFLSGAARNEFISLSEAQGLVREILDDECAADVTPRISAVTDLAAAAINPSRSRRHRGREASAQAPRWLSSLEAGQNSPEA